MQGIPTVDDVRDWLQVSVNAVSDADLSQILLGELSIQFRLLRIPDDPEGAGPFNASLDGMQATVVVNGGTPGVHYRLSWGDGQNADMTLDDNGDATAEHTYANPGTYMARASADDGTELATYMVTVPGDGSLFPEETTYPEALARALLRRCQRNVAARAVPLGALGLEGAEYAPLNLPAWDAEISRLEASYLIPVIA